MKRTTSSAYNASVLAACIIFAMLMNTSIKAQDKNNDGNQGYLKFWQMPSPLQSKYLALGDRMQKPGNERITIKGVLTDPSGSNDAQVVVEKGKKLRADIAAVKGAKSLRFDGKNAPNKTDEVDDDLLEALLDDSPEMFFEAAMTGTVLLVGLRFADEQGNLFDVYDVPMPAKGNAKSQRPSKRYFFNTKTNLLSYVQYRESKEKDATVIETQFNDWVIVDDQKVPSTVTRKRQGKVVFTLQGKTVSAAPAADDHLFAQ
jgi:hypothetical protein